MSYLRYLCLFALSGVIYIYISLTNGTHFHIFTKRGDVCP